MTNKDPSTTTPGQLKCPVCAKVFKRSEHLARHRRCHTNEKPYCCPRCGKCFARRDTLDRHVSVHEQRQLASGQRNSSRACQPCAISRIRCSRGLPCSQCTTRSRSCTYEQSQSRKGAAPKIHEPNQGQQGLSSEYEDQRQDHESGPTTAVSSALSRPVDGVDTSNHPPTNFYLPNTSVNLGNIPTHHHDEALIGGSEVSHTARPQTDALRNVEMNPNTDFMDLGVNWWTPGPQDTESWILDQALIADWHIPEFEFPTDSEQIAVDTVVAPVNKVVTNRYSTKSPAQSTRRIIESPSNATEPESLFTEAIKSISDGSGFKSNNAEPTSGQYYAEGNAGRLAFPGQYRRRKVLNQNTQSGTETTAERAVSGATLSEHHVGSANESLSVSEDYAMGHNVYAKLVISLRAALSQESLECDQQQFPTPSSCASFIETYFENFHIIFPFLRPTDVRNGQASWLVVLAVAAVGAHLEKSPSWTYLHAMLSRVLHINHATSHLFDKSQNSNTHADTIISGVSDIAMIQSSILNLVLMVQNLSAASVEHTLLERARLVERCESMGLLSNYHHSNDTIASSPKDWIRLEACRRAGWMIWLLDTVLAYQTNSSLRTRDVIQDAYLPSSDNVWNNPLGPRQNQNDTQSFSMEEALETIWIRKKLPNNTTPFNCVILVYAICRKIREVAAQNQTRLFAYITHAKKPFANADSLPNDDWPKGDTNYNKWRNSALDSIDVLHWSANAVIAENEGWEHPFVLTLHLSRLLLLAPLGDLQILAGDTMAKRHYSSDQRSQQKDPKTSARNRVIRWILQDTYKARLCLIHAGALFWHVRRYGTGVLNEPFGIYIATLALWTYSVVLQISAVNQPSTGARNMEDVPNISGPRDLPSQASGKSSSAVTSSTLETPFIYLDRPCDDEMVQNFVREGHLMTAYVSGVGSMSVAGATKKILRTGRHLLRAQNIGRQPNHGATMSETETADHQTGAQKHYLDLLSRLEAASE